MCDACEDNSVGPYFVLNFNYCVIIKEVNKKESETKGTKVKEKKNIKNKNVQL